jgi:hypothetical protein
VSDAFDKLIVCGRLAQLGERRVRNAEAGSSILPPSTTISERHRVNWNLSPASSGDRDAVVAAETPRPNLYFAAFTHCSRQRVLQVQQANPMLCAEVVRCLSVAQFDNCCIANRLLFHLAFVVLL